MLFVFASCCLNRYFTIPVQIKNARLRLALVIPTGAPMIVTNYAIEVPPVVRDKTINDLWK